VEAMQPIDKYGKPIYQHIYTVLKRNAAKLIDNGYNESYNKPNLFLKKIPEGCFFADMRSSDVVSIWEDTRPLFYRQFEDNISFWRRRRLIKQELEHLFKVGCECRLSFFSPRGWEEFENTSSAIGPGEYLWDDGFCQHCKKDFQDEGSFCSDKCALEYHKSFLKECAVCGKKLEQE